MELRYDPRKKHTKDTGETRPNISGTSRISSAWEELLLTPRCQVAVLTQGTVRGLPLFLSAGARPP